MLESVQSLLTLISSYSFAAKLGMLASLSALIAIAVLGYPAQKTGENEKGSFSERLLACDSLAEVQTIIRSMSDEFANHVQENGPRNESLAYLVDFRCSGHEFDALVYSYNEPANQSPHWLFLFDFYDSSHLDLNLIDSDWKAVEILDFDSAKEALEVIRGFNAPLEIVSYSPVGSELYRPAIVYVQVVAGRDGLNQRQIAELRARQADAIQRDGVYRITATYDKLVSGSLP